MKTGDSVLDFWLYKSLLGPKCPNLVPSSGVTLNNFQCFFPNKIDYLKSHGSNIPNAKTTGLLSMCFCQKKKHNQSCSKLPHQYGVDFEQKEIS